MNASRLIAREMPPRGSRLRRRRWTAIGWFYSAAAVVPIVILGLLIRFDVGRSDGSEPRMTFTVVDAASGLAVVGASVSMDGRTIVTGSDGRVTVAPTTLTGSVQVSAPGYLGQRGTLGEHLADEQRVLIHPISTASDLPLGDEAASSATSAAPPAATTGAAATTTDLTPIQGSNIAGVVLDGNGAPIVDALIRSGSETARSGPDGGYSLGVVGDRRDLVVSASGYADRTVSPSESLSVRLARREIKAAYVSGNAAASPSQVDRIVTLVDSTELNAVVIDVKESVVYYDTKVEFFRKANAVKPVFDAAAVVKRFRDRGIYTIARIVVFKDPLVAEAYPDLAVKDDRGGLWRGAEGEAWVNPFEKGLWQPNIDLALEAARFGFDEVQYDYIRFPSDGDLSTANFGPDYSEAARVGAIVGFLKEAQSQIAPSGAKLAVDIFGIVAVYPDDQGIGQRLADIAPYVDYVCAMVYPSHFDATSIDVGGKPNDFPYETIKLSLRMAKAKMPGMELKLRPWLQDFSLPGMTAYGAEQLQAQIKASDEADVGGWMLWNANSTFTESALKADSGPNA